MFASFAYVCKVCCNASDLGACRQGECKYAALGCDWLGAADERDAHEAACALAKLTGEQILGLLRAKSSAGAFSGGAGALAGGSVATNVNVSANVNVNANATPVAVVRPCLPATTQSGALAGGQSPSATIRALQNALELFSSDRVALIGILYCTAE